MTCYHPIECILPSTSDSDGKKKLIFSQKHEGMFFDDSPIVRDIADYANIKGFKIKVPCGRCIGCRLDYSRHWAIRAMNEASLYRDNCFVTLTLNDDHLNGDRSLQKGMIQSWLKRFRKRYGEGIRYLLCGEYGEKFQRPHYHILFFNFRFPDLKVHSFNKQTGEIYYRSNQLEELWTDPWSPDNSRGYSVVGDVEFQSAAYVSRYVTKKVFSKDKKYLEQHYGLREPEFLLMSRRPGLGTEYFKEYYNDIINHDCVAVRNKKSILHLPVPRFYVNMLKDIDPELYKSYKVDKLQSLYDNLFVDNPDLSTERLLVREELKKSKCDRLVRNFEFDPLLHNIY